jgi:tripartite-type tricarboxylate transporter receptor subunit TctC
MTLTRRHFIAFMGAGGLASALPPASRAQSYPTRAVRVIVPYAAKSGQLRALAITSATRSNVFPDVPTMAEAGLPNQESEFMQGVLFPAGTSKELVDRWQREILRIVALPDVRARLATLGFDAVASTPEAFAARVKSEVPRWAKVVRDANLKRID